MCIRTFKINSDTFDIEKENAHTKYNYKHEKQPITEQKDLLTEAIRRYCIRNKSITKYKNYTISNLKEQLQNNSATNISNKKFL